MTGNVWVVLGENFKNARIRTFEDNLSEGNYCYVAGKSNTDDNDARYRPVEEHGDSTLSGIFRREIYVNASSAEDSDAMTTAADEALADAESTTVEMDLLKQSLYGSAFYLGDTVSVDMGIYGHYVLQVTGAEVRSTSEERAINLTLGNERKSIIRVLRDSITSIGQSKY